MTTDSDQIIIKPYSPLPHQKALHNLVTKHLNTYKKGSEDFQKIITVVSPRQVGKTLCAIAEILRFAFEYPKGTGIYITPTISLGKKVFEDICRKCRDLIKKSNASDLIIEFLSGHRFYFKSAEQGDSIRGFNVKNSVLIVDEAAYIQDSFYYNIVSPFVDFNKELTIIISSPYFRNGFFYENYIKGLDSGYSINFSDYDLTSIRSEERLEEIRQSVPLRTYLSEYLGEWLTAEGSPFKFEECIYKESPTEFKRLYWGLDLASGNNRDYTVLTALTEDKKIFKIFRWNDIPPTEQVTKIVEILSEYKDKSFKIFVDSTGLGTIFKDLLRRSTLPFVYKVFNNDYKQKLIDNLTLHFEQQRISIPNDKDLIKELQFYQIGRSSTGKLTFNAKSGYTDDIVTSLALALDASNYTGLNGLKF